MQEKNYATEVKRHAIKLAKERKNKSKLASELGISPTLLYKWCSQEKEFGQGRFPGNGNLKLTSGQGRIGQLEKKIVNVEFEHEILKKLKGFSQRPTNDLEVSRSSYYHWKGL